MAFLYCLGEASEDPLPPPVTPPRIAWAKQDVTLSSHSRLFIVKESIQCLFEGGANCRKEDPKRQKGENAIRGIHSSWVGTHIIASARPQQPIIEQEDSLSDFHSKNVKAIVNLQEVGEHASCGSGILKQSGFSYDPDYFMRSGICVYNFPAVDMNSPRTDSMLDSVQVIDYHVRKKNEVVLVHCHAGLGRTGTVIACYFLYSQNILPEEAIAAVRECRPNSIETRSQIKFVHSFSKFLNRRYRYFSLPWIRAELSRTVTLEAEGTIMNGTSDGARSNEGEVGRPEGLLHRINALEKHYKQIVGGGADAVEFDAKENFEKALQGQEMLLHGSERKGHPVLLWKLAEALYEMRRSNPDEKSISSKAAQIVSELSNEKNPAVELEVLAAEIDCHLSKWESCKSLSLAQILQLLDQWLLSIQPVRMDIQSTEKLASDGLLPQQSMKGKLLECCERQLALTIYALAIILALVLGTIEGGEISIGESAEPQVAILDWLACRLLCRKGEAGEIASGEGSKENVRVVSQLLWKLCEHAASHFPPVFQSDLLYNL